MKKVLSLLAVAGVFTFASCETKTTETSETTTSETTVVETPEATEVIVDTAATVAPADTTIAQ
ncbi:MAG TPA: hypothetical protein VK927_10430 [Adhaeribacter sp.]|nr:hypothetical protein [Adhaeribacter sp.]